MNVIDYVDNIHSKLNEAGTILGKDYLSATPSEKELLFEMAQLSPSEKDWFIRANESTGYTGRTY